MTPSALTKYFIVVLAAVGFVPALMAGPEQLPDRSKESKNVEMVQPPPVCDPRWYISIGGGGDFNIGDTHINDAVRRDFNVQFFGFPFPVGSADIKSHNFDDVYDDGYHIQGEIGYALTQHLELFGSFRYAHADAANRTTGSSISVDFPGVFTGVFPIESEFEDYDSWGGELGFRYYFLSRQAHWRPYLAVSGGASHVDGIGITTFADLTDVGGGDDVQVFKGSFLEENWVATAAAVVGLEFNVTCHWTLGVNGGVRYASRLDDDDSDLNRDGFSIANGFATVRSFRFANESNNNSGDRWTVPVTGYLKFRF